MSESGKRSKRSARYDFASFVRLPVGLTSLETDGESLSHYLYVEQLAMEKVIQVAGTIFDWDTTT